MNTKLIAEELVFKAVRSGGAGGQHVNKVSSKVELSFDVGRSQGLTPNEKERLLQKLSGKLTKDHLLLLQCDESRSQHRNKELVVSKFFSMLEKGLLVPKRRIRTKPGKSAIEKRLTAKKKSALKKVNRRKWQAD
ncbi:alternative ribosome rescue aminoacyl-tRNA hydrolase ArfB [Arenibacter sp. GZD96]|uniref:alternative ribosome rescue aminoacyl-tRNA hydrolase ArfB n=1 Tax=Aurantibrevibacter litoralis TaxID=3106030 RepID=UPI002AFEC5FD|nr:alternative ribosome rescue aminoacyl-tRNA hydrolase ArfB [Arenibacter sp. GZD-96]MEA1784467.1 alternative ribosome rescue aminoacyl-tRNA hydrolase ArfB [Arenibacter sp. GZD-96]